MCITFLYYCTLHFPHYKLHDNLKIVIIYNLSSANIKNFSSSQLIKLFSIQNFIGRLFMFYDGQGYTVLITYIE